MTDAAAIVATPLDTWPREILVTKRSSGYLRLHVPPVLYAPALGPKLQRALLPLRGVRRVRIERGRARVSVDYDPWLTDDRPILVAIDALASPLVERMDPDAFATALAEQRDARNFELAERGARAAYLGLLIYVHYWVGRAALRDPVRLWWVWALVAFGVWTHRKQIAEMKLRDRG